MPVAAKPVRITVGEGKEVSGLLQKPEKARAGFVLAHGAGAGMKHAFLEAFADGLGERGIAVLRYQFPYMEKGTKRPDPPRTAHATVRAAVSQTAKLLPKLPLFAGGKSFGGRMTSQAQAEEPLKGAEGLAFVGFPLHPAGQPSDERAEHLFNVHVPMLFLQGSRDDLASLGFLRPVIAKLGDRAELEVYQGADHSFRVSGHKDSDTRAEMLDRLVVWIDKHI